MRSVQAIHYVRPMGIGYSSPQLLRADDGNDYVVKFRSNGQGLRVLPNEWIAGRCAHALGLPLPRMAVVNVPQSLLDATPELSPFRATPGSQFGSEFMPQGHCEPWQDLLASADNLDDLAGILVFDTWIHTKDRSWRSSNLNVIQDQAGRYRVIIFDHGWVFGGTPNWSSQSLRAQRSLVKPPFMAGSVYNLFRPHIRGDDPFEPWLERVESLPPKIIRQAIWEVPSEWGLNFTERKALADYLIRRRHLVRPVIMGIRGLFPHWK